MPRKYKSRKERRSRLAHQENQRLFRQTILIVLIFIVILAALIFLGIPALIKLAVFFGDIRSSSTPITQTDTIPPATPQLDTIPQATSSSSISISGFSESGATVKLFHNGSKTDESVTDVSGKFSFNNIDLKSGLNRFYTLAIDDNNNESLRSSTQTVVLDSDAPTLEITEPNDGREFYGTSEKIVTIKGTTDPNVTLNINDQHIVVNSIGSFSTNFPLNDGDNSLTIIAIDKAGNKIEKSLKLIYHP